MVREGGGGEEGRRGGSELSACWHRSLHKKHCYERIMSVARALFTSRIW